MSKGPLRAQDVYVVGSSLGVGENSPLITQDAASADGFNYQDGIYTFSTAADNWHDHVEAFRAWTVRQGVERPIIVSETAYPNGSAEYNAKLVTAIGEALATDDDLLAVLWYSAFVDYHGLWPKTGLLDGDGALTPVGEAFIRVRSGVQPQREWRAWLPVTVKN